MTSFVESGSGGGLSSSSSPSSTVVLVHPLVLLNVSEHWTRTMLASGERAQRVCGCLLGRVLDGAQRFELVNSFDMASNDNSADGQIVVDGSLFESRFLQYREMFDDLELVGFYTTGAFSESDTPLLESESFLFEALHAKLSDGVLIHDPPALLLKLNPFVNPRDKKELPIQLHEWNLSRLERVANVQVVTEPGERFAVEHLSKQIGTGVDVSDEGAVFVSAAQGYTAAVSMLLSRIKVIGDYVADAQSGAIQDPDPELLAEALALSRQLEALEPDAFAEAFERNVEDALLGQLVTAAVGVSSTLANFTMRMNTLSDDRYGQHMSQLGFGGRSGGGGGGGSSSGGSGSRGSWRSGRHGGRNRQPPRGGQQHDFDLQLDFDAAAAAHDAHQQRTSGGRVVGAGRQFVRQLQNYFKQPPAGGGAQQPLFAGAPRNPQPNQQQQQPQDPRKQQQQQNNGGGE